MSEKETYEFDVVTEYIPLDEKLTQLFEEIQGVEAVIKAMRGPGGGWPWIFVTIPSNAVAKAKLKNWYFGDAASDISDEEFADYKK